MRITQNQMTRQYLNNTNSALTNMNEINNKILSQRKFTRASQDSVGAAKALIIRRNLEKTEMYKSNLDTADTIFSAAEKSLLSISNSSTTLTDSIVQGVNGTQGDDERKILAEQIRNIAKEMISQINTEYADRKLFGGTNNSTPPFSYDETTGTLNFNGVDINTNDITLFPKTKSIYLDVGLGMQFDASGNVDEQTVMDISLNGAEVLGYGTDADGDPNNIIALAYKTASLLENNDVNGARAMIEKINQAKSNLTISITEIGNKEQTVAYSRERIENDQYTLQVSQQSVEGIDLAEEITKYEVAKMAYNATLQMGSSIIPSSIFDYIK